MNLTIVEFKVQLGVRVSNYKKDMNLTIVEFKG